jgi:putative two-component system response regulator
MIKISDNLQAKILIVDDQQVNIQLIKQILMNAGYSSIYSTLDPFQVCSLHKQNSFDLIMLDLQMPGMDGFQVMQALKEIEPDGYLPVLVITAQPGHKLRALNAGAKDFVSKPFELAEILARVHNMLEVRLLQKSLRNYNETLQVQVRETTADLKESYLETILSMMRAVEYKDGDTGAHGQRISFYCREFARLLGMDEGFIERITFASPMHDIGKIGIPDHILQKPGVLTEDEWKVMRGHTVMGSIILGNSKSPYLQMGAEIALNHHERWNGGGYPNGIQAEDIPLAARIMYMCDNYDSLRSKRSYKPAFDHLKTVEILLHGDGRIQPENFDPDIHGSFKKNNQVFNDIFEEYAP